MVPPPPGERKREGIKSLGLHQELTLSDSPFEIGLGEFESDLVKRSSTPSSPKGGRRIVTPRGGPPPPTLFCPAHGGRIGLRGRTLGVCALKKVGLLAFLAFLALLAL